MKYLKYLSYVLRHKWYVLLACCQRGLWWRGLVHDLSKFRPSEFFPYANHFHGPKDIQEGRDKTGYYKPTDTGDPAFDHAWFLHQKRNQHHWQYWVIPEDGGGVKLLPMPEVVVTEMVCDWIGAGRAQNNPTSPKDWFAANRNKMQLHPTTEARIDELLNQETS